MVRLGRPSKALGRYGERLAEEYLVEKGLRVLDRNWRCQHGEIDLVAFDDASRTLIFVEVKTRTGLGFGTPLEAITQAKARKLYELARMWMKAHSVRASRVRVDGVGVLLGREGRKISHLEAVST